MKKEQEFNVLPSPLDERVHIYDNLKMVYNGVSLPSKFELITPPVKSQKFTSWCVSFASTYMQYCDDLVKYGEAELLSQGFLHKHCKDIDKIPQAKGTTPESACKVLTKYGVCEEKLYAFTGDENDRNNTFKPITEEMYKNAKKHKAKSYARVSTLESLKNAIYNENGAIIALNIFNNFEKDKRGYICPPPKLSTTSPEGRHCVFCCGWDDEHEAYVDGKLYKGFIKIQESDGLNSSANGYRYLAYDLWNSYAYYGVDKLVVECWTTYDNENLIDKDYHKDKFNINTEIVQEKKKVIELTIGQTTAYVEGQPYKLTTPPKVVNGTTFVPIRFIVENFDEVSIFWHGDTKTIRVYDNINRRNFYLKIGRKEITDEKGEVVYTLLEPPMIDGGSTLIPVRAVSELLGATVGFNSATKTITIKR